MRLFNPKHLRMLQEFNAALDFFALQQTMDARLRLTRRRVVTHPQGQSALGECVKNLPRRLGGV